MMILWLLDGDDVFRRPGLDGNRKLKGMSEQPPAGSESRMSSVGCIKNFVGRNRCVRTDDVFAEHKCFLSKRRGILMVGRQRKCLQ